jgi:hypothetical protein
MAQLGEHPYYGMAAGGRTGSSYRSNPKKGCHRAAEQEQQIRPAMFTNFTGNERLNGPAQILWKMCCLLRSERYPGKIRTEYPRRMNWLSGSTVFQDPSIMIRCNYAALFLLTIGVSAIAALDSKIAA